MTLMFRTTKLLMLVNFLPIFSQTASEAEQEAKKFPDKKALDAVRLLNPRIAESERKEAYKSAHKIAFKAKFERRFFPYKYFFEFIRHLSKKAISEILKRL